jgi:hypothetical protein
MSLPSSSLSRPFRFIWQAKQAREFGEIRVDGLPVR